MKEYEATNPVRTVETALQVVEGLEELEGASLTELATYLDAPKSTVHNHLSTLMEQNYLVKEEDDYYLGLRFTELGEQIKNRQAVFTQGRSEVEKLATETQELTNLAVQEHGKAIYLHRASGQNAISTDTFAGKRVNLHCTSLGKAMLAYMPESRVQTILDRYGLPARTENTITERDELLEELEAVREGGIAFDDEERAYGIRCVAAPILHQETKQAVGAVSVSAPTNRMQDQRFTEEIPEQLQNIANVIEIELTYAE